MVAYLVIREGSKWTDVFRLSAGRTATIGRASTNQIVVKDERCSRNHAEVFFTGGKWTIRDLDSRNGTRVAGEPVQGDHHLTEGEIIRIGQCQMAFVHDLSKAFVDEPNEDVTETVTGPVVINLADTHTLDDAIEPTTITHRRNHTRFLQRPADETTVAAPKLGKAAAKLCRLAFELAKQTSVTAVANHALDGLFEGTNVKAGAVLLLESPAAESDSKGASETPKDASEANGDEPPRRDPDVPLSAENLKTLASRTDMDSSYHRVSDFLGNMVLQDGEAVLARNIEGDRDLGIRDSHGAFRAKSVICAPIRKDSHVMGLVHLYSMNEQATLDAADLEFTLAVADNLALALQNLGRQKELSENLTQSQSEIEQLRKRLGVESEIVGTSPLMRSVQEEVGRAAPSRATILIRGESGVGKELVARAVHFSSPRMKGPFVCLNCAALSETLLESELFGHERGAFTGATERKVGKFEAAHQGTLMLDEIGEMSSAIQSKFLRVLEGHPFERVGGSKAIKVDVRVIAATNRDLEKAVAEGTFRRDLYFRLHVVEIEVPPLRKRPADILDLADHFLERFNQETGRKIEGFTPAALGKMQHYHWPGNVRELKNVVERAVLLTQHEAVDVDDLTLSNLASASESGELPLPPTSAYEPITLSEIEMRHVAATLTSTKWNKSRAAEILGIERSTLDRKIRRYNLKPSV